MRIITCQVLDEHIKGAGVPIGAAGSFRDVALRLTFSPMWDGLAKMVTWHDAILQQQHTDAILPTMMVEGMERTYDVPIPWAAKHIEGLARMTITGYELDEDGETKLRQTVSVAAKFPVEHAEDTPGAPDEQESIDADLAEQILAAVAGLEDLAQEAIAAGQRAVTAANSAANSASMAASAAQSAQEDAGDAYVAAMNAQGYASQATISARAAGSSASQASQQSALAQQAAETAADNADAAIEAAEAAAREAASVTGLAEQIERNKAAIADLDEGKQEKLVAGENITIRGNVISSTGGGGGGTGDHRQLTNRDAENQHPISAIEGLQDELDGKWTQGPELVLEAASDGGAAAITMIDEESADGGMYATLSRLRSSEVPQIELYGLENDSAVRIRGIADPVWVSDAANKAYVDTAISNAIAVIDQIADDILEVL